MLESQIQQAAIFEINTRYKGLVIYATLGGGRRDKREAAKLKREGARPGIPDLVVPYARNGYHALYIEVKRPGQKPRRSQIEFINFLKENNYKVEVLDDVSAIVKCVAEYVGKDYIKHHFYD